MMRRVFGRAISFLLSKVQVNKRKEEKLKVSLIIFAVISNLLLIPNETYALNFLFEKDPYELYIGAVDTMNEATSISMNNDISVSMNIDGEKIDARMTGSLKQIKTSTSKYELEMIQNTNSFGQNMALKMYYKDGYMYVDVDGTRAKVATSIEDAMNQPNIPAVIFQNYAIRNSNLQKTIGGTKVSFLLDGNGLRDYVLRNMQGLDAAALAGGDISFGDGSLSALIDKKGNLKEMSFAIDYAVVVEGMQVSMKMSIYISDVKTDGVRIDYPAYIDSYGGGSSGDDTPPVPEVPQNSNPSNEHDNTYNSENFSGDDVKFKFTGPTDVFVVKDGEILASVKNNEASIYDGAVVISTTRDQEKMVYSPNDSRYHVYIKATDNGTMTVLRNIISNNSDGGSDGSGFIEPISYDIKKGDVFEIDFETAYPLVTTDTFSDLPVASNDNIGNSIVNFMKNHFLFSVIILATVVLVLIIIIIFARKRKRKQNPQKKINQQQPLRSQQPYVVPPQALNQAAFCLRCGKPVIKGKNFCGNCGAPLADAPAKPENIFAFPTLHLQTTRHKIPLTSGAVIYQYHLDETGSDRTKQVGVVRSKPDDTSDIGIKNVSDKVWYVKRPDEAMKTIEPSSTVKIVKGTLITIGSYSAEVV